MRVLSTGLVATAERGCDLVLHRAALPSVPRSIQGPPTSDVVEVTGTLEVLGERERSRDCEASRTGAGPHPEADVDPARRRLGFEPAVGLREGLFRLALLDG